MRKGREGRKNLEPTHLFKVCNSLVFIIFTGVCNYHQNQFPNIFITLYPQTLHLLAVTPHFSSLSPAPCNVNLLSVPVDGKLFLNWDLNGAFLPSREVSYLSLALVTYSCRTNYPDIQQFKTTCIHFLIVFVEQGSRYSQAGSSASGSLIRQQCVGQGCGLN